MHLRAYDLQKRVENLEDRQQSIRARVYAELQKSRDQIVQEVESYLDTRREESDSGNGDIGQALLMQMMGMGMMGQEQPTREEQREQDIHDILIGSGGNGGDHEPSNDAD